MVYFKENYNFIRFRGGGGYLTYSGGGGGGGAGAGGPNAYSRNPWNF